MLSITKMLITMNYSKDITIKPEYIVIHETDNEDVHANAMANRNYFANHEEAQASTHFVVDDNTIVQCAELNWRCWHVGDNKGYSNITNSNSIGIEICVNEDGNYDKARQNAIELTKYLMVTLNLNADRVVKHQNASGKYCPRKMIDNPQLWTNFKYLISQTSEKIIIPKTEKLQKQIESWIYWLNLDYNAKITVRSNGSYMESELFPNIEAVGKLIVLGHKSHLVQFFQQKLEMWGYLKPNTYKIGEFDSITRGAVTELQKKWGRVTDGKILISNNTAQIFLNNE